MEIKALSSDNKPYLEHALYLNKSSTIEEWMDKILTYNEYLAGIPVDISQFDDKFQALAIRHKAEEDNDRRIEEFANSFGPQDVT